MIWTLPGTGRRTDSSPDPRAVPRLGAALDDPQSLIELAGVSRVYQMGADVEVAALRGIDLRIETGEFVAIVGPSGSGKSTLMHIVGCLDRPTSGSYRLDGVDVEALDDDDLAALRSRSIGFVFQSYNLLSRTSALENVATPLLYQGIPRRRALEQARDVLERLGLGDRLDHEPTQLSGGQQQRVAIARALATEPSLLLADEPTGNLASDQGTEVLDLFRELHRAGRTIVLITHDPDVAAAADRQVHVRDGRIAA